MKTFCTVICLFFSFSIFSVHESSMSDNKKNCNFKEKMKATSDKLNGLKLYTDTEENKSSFEDKATSVK